MKIANTSSWLPFNSSDAKPSSWGKVDLSRIQAVKEREIPWGIQSALNCPISCWTSEDKGGSTKASALLSNLPRRTSSFTIPWCLNKQHLIWRKWKPCVLMTLPHMYCIILKIFQWQDSSSHVGSAAPMCCCPINVVLSQRLKASLPIEIWCHWILKSGVEMHAANALCTTWQYQRLKTEDL